MATFAALAEAKLPDKDRAGQPIMFDSYDISPVLFGPGKSPRSSWFYFTENALTPGSARVDHYKAVFNLRGDDGVKTGGLAVDSNLGWKGPESYVATVPQVFGANNLLFFLGSSGLLAALVGFGFIVAVQNTLPSLRPLGSEGRME